MTGHSPIIRSATKKDAGELAGIYNYYVANSCATFETEVVTSEQMQLRIDETLADCLPWLVAEVSGRILGYAYASSWKERYAYRFSVESTVYLDVNETQKGIGQQLNRALLDALRSASVHLVIAGIALPNEHSIRLHERLGFTKAGYFEQVGYKHGRWVDVGYWQLLL